MDEKTEWVLIDVSAGGITSQVYSGETGQFLCLTDHPARIYWGADSTYEALSDAYHNKAETPEAVRQWIAENVLKVPYKVFADLTERRQWHRQVASLNEAVKFYDQDDNRHRYCVLVRILFPRGGIYRIQHYHGAGGCCAGFNLEPVMLFEEELAIHDAAVKVAQQGGKVFPKPALTVAFERVEAIEYRKLHGHDKPSA